MSKYTKMTLEERMVWATIYALEMQQRHNPPAHVSRDSETMHKWELEQSANAAACACGTVVLLRESNLEIIESYGGQDEVTKMYHEMVGK